jgi:tetratricopeptide (TPR) repeat protein
MLRLILHDGVVGGHIIRAAVAFAVLTVPAWAAFPDAIQMQSTPDKMDGDNNSPPKDFSKQALIKPLLDKLAATKDAQTAKAIAEAVAKLWAHSSSPTVDLLMGQVTKAMVANDADRALSLLDLIVEIAPGFAEGWNRRATVLFMKRSYEASMADISKVLELEPRHFGALSGLGLVLRAMGNKKAALRAFRKALAVHPFLPGALLVVKELEPEVEGRGI